MGTVAIKQCHFQNGDLNCFLLQTHIMAKIRKEYFSNPDFDPAKVANASSAAEGLCKWILAMEIYDRVAKVVAPKKEKLKQAEGDLEETMAQLNQKRAELRAVEERLANLKQSFAEMTEKKGKLEFQVLMNGGFIVMKVYWIIIFSIRCTHVFIMCYVQYFLI